LITLYDAAAAAMLAALICVTLLPRTLTSRELLFSVSARNSREIARRVLIISYMRGYSNDLRRSIELSDDPSQVLERIASLCPTSNECRVSILSLDRQKLLAQWGSNSSTFSENSEVILTVGSTSLVMRCDVGSLRSDRVQ